ncbi:MAG: hypothetical protein ABI886_15745 [Betaproteobacteria bacterium]
MECTATESDDVAQVAVFVVPLPLSDFVPQPEIVVPSAEKLTVPVGVTEVVATVAVKVTLTPDVDVAPEVSSVVVDAARSFHASVTGPFALPFTPASPVTVYTQPLTTAVAPATLCVALVLAAGTPQPLGFPLAPSLGPAVHEYVYEYVVGRHDAVSCVERVCGVMAGPGTAATVQVTPARWMQVTFRSPLLDVDPNTRHVLSVSVNDAAWTGAAVIVVNSTAVAASVWIRDRKFMVGLLGGWWTLPTAITAISTPL